ncbi:nucleotide sugar dehydrogenase [Eremomyces bilateralis CBS 781.70]|uniref:Nucleotide sugar dehydrogenase n=1 Tax=Eremomyces bilateralis CBS 781.70 TaxID=1392243 RepID=A0A6G1G0W7_9PEZI|nr:nucleotide sugar dehydrogenase [Eremomyces bilateralis CBS 781.70]KAF1811683.1 nucleotide sugar dehydrogenase [Eremomyces bilateralis CBS 781.70]
MITTPTAAEIPAIASVPSLPGNPSIVAIIGTGYVGYNLVKCFAPHYEVLAFDVNEKRVEQLCAEFESPRIHPTNSPVDLSRATHFLISVPTNVLPDKSIDTSCLQKAIQTVGGCARPGSTVVIESSVAVGMTRRLLGPLMRLRGLKAGMSPERVDPGRTSPTLVDTPKIISGITPESLESIKELYGPVFNQLVPVSRPEVAEMAKLYENCQRMVCIAYANELADACIEHDISAFEVCSAAASKPFGYSPFTPSLGVGGHCIPVNPFYLFASSSRPDSFPILRSATERNWGRPAAVGDYLMSSLFKSSQYRDGIAKGPPRILIVGAGFKRGQSVLSNSPGVALMKHLKDAWELKVIEFADPMVRQEQLPEFRRIDESLEWNVENLRKYCLIIIAIRQDGLDFSVLDTAAQGTYTRVEYYCP